MAVDLLTLRDEVLARLRTQPNWTVYDGEPSGDVPVDSAGRAKAYACLYMGPTYNDVLTEALSSGDGSRQLTFQVTVASGYTTTTLRASEKADIALLGDPLVSLAGKLRRDPAGYIQEDRDETPSRWFIPHIYRVDLGDG